MDGQLLKSAQWDFLDQQAFTGFDNDANMVKIAILNLYLHQLERAKIEHHNPLTTTIGGQYPGPRYDIILANPPFAGDRPSGQDPLARGLSQLSRDAAVEAEDGSGRHFKVVSVWFAPSRKILFNSAADNQMANEPFSRVLMGRELEFSGRMLLNPKEERFEFDCKTGLAGFG